VGFHSLKSIIDLAIKNELKVFDVEMINSQGGSIRCYLIKKKSKRKTLKSVNKILDIEKKCNLFSKKNLKAFKIKIKKHSLDMNNLITKLKKKGKKISIYGASGKGQALMHFCKMDNRLIDYVFDKSSLKQGKFTPGTNIKILNPKFISNQNIDYLIILSWNIQEEIIKQEKKFLKKGGKFIIPFPNPRIIN
jgi:hypothetical protein